MVMKDLTFIYLGNKTTVEDLINFEKLRMLSKEIRGLMNMCSSNLDIFKLIRSRQGTDVSEAQQLLNPGMTLKKQPSGMLSRKNRDALNPKKMHEEVCKVF